MTQPDLDGLVATFRHFARHEFRGHSARYAQLSEAVADRPALAAPLLAAPQSQRRAILFFAAVQYALRTSASGHPLAGYLPTLDGERDPDAGFVPAFADLVTTHAAELTELCARRTTQTNEARRAALLLPGLTRAAERLSDRPLALVELGCSAGLLLLPDRYGYRYVGESGPPLTAGRPDAPPSIVMTCSVREPRLPEGTTRPFTIADRVGIDLAPARPDDADSVQWLRSCIWPEHVERLARLDAALAEAAALRPRLVAGDMVAELPAIVASVDHDAVPVVFASNAVTYLPGQQRRRLVEVLAALGAHRDLAVVLNEAAQNGAELFLRGRPAEAGPPGVLNVGLLTVITWRKGEAAVEVLARTGPHGEWLTWTPRQYPYAPPATSPVAT